MLEAIVGCARVDWKGDQISSVSSIGILCCFHFDIVERDSNICVDSSVYAEYDITRNWGDYEKYTHVVVVVVVVEAIKFVWN